jgi:glycerate dehydrogenase
MQIVVPDSHTLSMNDLSWDDLKALGDCTFYDRTSPEDIVKRCKNAEAILTNKVGYNEALLQSLPKLRYIGVTATGYNIIDINAAKKQGITVTNVPAYSTMSVAQTVIALLLELTNHTGHYAREVREGVWARSPDFCFYDRPTIELAGLTMGIVGFGHIGQAVAALAQALGMKVLTHVRSSRDLPPGVTACSLEDLLRQSDVVTLHCPLTNDTQHLINAERLKLMKKSAFLINSSRGPLVDEQALAAALNSQQIAGAGLDVLSTEPPDDDNPLPKARNCVITPHIAWATKSARQRLMGIVIGNLKAFQAGKPVNVVS